MICIIVAIDRNGAIGCKGNLLYHISEDLRRFKRLTVGNTIVMGRKTFESLPKGALPERRNIVISRQGKGYKADGIDVAESVEAALAIAAEGPGDTFVIGGAEIYRQMLPFADRLELTLIDAKAAEADAFFPEIDPEEWETSDISDTTTDPKTMVKYNFTSLQRKK